MNRNLWACGLSFQIEAGPGKERSRLVSLLKVTPASSCVRERPGSLSVIRPTIPVEGGSPHPSAFYESQQVSSQLILVRDRQSVRGILVNL